MMSMLMLLKIVDVKEREGERKYMLAREAIKTTSKSVTTFIKNPTCKKR